MDKASSPYLKQHENNPIFWQEWNKETLEHARKENKMILVSIGYSTCHWCHVMAREAFSDEKVSSYINKNFISIKVDREQRPDIDHYYMNFIQSTRRGGGWPLNVVCTPDAEPLYAFTYYPINPKIEIGLCGILDLLDPIKNSYERNKKIPKFEQITLKPINYAESQIFKELLYQFDNYNGGFGYAQKFSPSSTLLFMLHSYENSKNEEIKKMIEKTLEVMALRGLHDHLQGGFFRYCVDSNWTIPHFEKMLYDQAMLLWIYSNAYKVLKKESYKVIIDKIVNCLKDTFQDDDLYYSAIDADTNHEEGKTYVWDEKEIEKNLYEGEYEKFSSVYALENNFEDKIHLIKKKEGFIPEVEKKLLEIRKKREQPFTDRKIITSWNALTGIALIHAFRATRNQEYLEM